MEAIDYKWQSECRTKVGMKKRARDYLSSKIFGRAVPDNQDFCWRQLNRDNLPGHTFTFWQWFYSVLGKLDPYFGSRKFQPSSDVPFPGDTLFSNFRIDEIAVYSTTLEFFYDRRVHLETRMPTVITSKGSWYVYVAVF